LWAELDEAIQESQSLHREAKKGAPGERRGAHRAEVPRECLGSPALRESGIAGGEVAFSSESTPGVWEVDKDRWGPEVQYRAQNLRGV